jgi:ribosomal protein S18 acetylase RimI-like enzyme
MTAVRIKRGLPENQLVTATNLIAAAFDLKLEYEVRARSPEQAFRVIEGGISPERAWVALDAAGSVVGIAGVGEPGRPFLHVPLRLLVGEFGWLGAVPRKMRIAFMHETIRPRADQWCLDILAVDESCRGLGIGSSLLTAMKNAAVEAGIKSVLSAVVDTNERAYKLYTRFGFVRTRTVRTGWLTSRAGFRAAHLITLDLT